MTDEAKNMLLATLSILKTQMHNDGLIFGFAIDTEDIDNSRLCFISKERYLADGGKDGVMIGLDELNRGLL
jgi:hypothetical protein